MMMFVDQLFWDLEDDEICLDFLHLLGDDDGVGLANLFGPQLLVVELTIVFITVAVL